MLDQYIHETDINGDDTEGLCLDESDRESDIQPSLVPTASILAFGGSLSRMMKCKFSGRKGKKVYSDERLNALECRHCGTKGHTLNNCINKAARPVNDTPWVRELLQKPAFHIERLTKDKSWQEVQEIIEREGELHNRGNPWMHSTLRRDMLRKNLGYWYVIGANQTVLSWLGYGVPMRFLTEPDHYRFRNHEVSMVGHEQFVKDEHAVRVADGSFVKLDPVKDKLQVRIINPIMISVNKKGKPRMCHDMRWPNGYLPHVDFRMETLAKELADVVAPGDELLSIDIATAYYSVPLHPDAQPYLCWEYDGIIYRPTVIVFGVSPAPQVFTKIMRPWMSLCRSVRVKLMGMIDDYLFSVIRSEAPALAIFIRYSLTRLGWQLNEKCQLTPQPRLTILGMIVDTSKMIVEAPAEKVRDALTLVRRALVLGSGQQWIDVSLLQQLCGKLQSMVLALPGVRVFTRALYGLIAKALEVDRIPRYKVHLEEYDASIDELLFWQQRLSPKFNGLPIHVRAASVKMWVDASDIGWGGEVMGQQYHGQLKVEEVSRSSTRRELIGLVTLGQQAVELIRNQHVHVYMDSYPAICNLTAGGGPKPDLVEAVKQWFQFCETNGITATYEWIPREQNVTADRYSKMAAIQYQLLDGVEIVIRNWLSTVCGDSARAATIPLFIPNFNVIPLRLESIIMNMSEAILITPQWMSQSWWPTVMTHRITSMYLGSIERVLVPTQLQWTRGWKMEAHWMKGRRRMTVTAPMRNC